MPKRLLRIGSSGYSVRLVEGIPTSESYVALSHCWKSSRPQKTTRSNIGENLKSIPLSNMSPTLRDAVIVTRWLRVRYIWIDSLCIIQDDDKDWESQAAKMGTIFQNAYVTIAAHVDKTSSFDNGFLGHNGVFKFNHSGAMNRDVFVRNSLQHTLSASYHNYYTTDRLNQSAIVPLLQEGLWGRGWCFQERLLSSRVINFFPNEEIVFECFEGTRCECDDVFNHFEGWEDSTKRFSIKNSPVDGTAGPRLADLIRRSGSADHQSQEHRKDLLRRLWSFIVDEYSSKNLSYCTDTLPALSSTANLMPRDMFGSYVAGLWNNQLVSDMAWFAKYTKSPRRRHPTYVAPTFSWASAAGPVYIGSEPWQACASVVDVNCSLHGTDPYGKVTSGAVTLYTRVCPFRVRRESRHVRRDGRKVSVWQSTALGNKHSETIVLEIDTDDDVDRVALDGNLAIRLTKHLDGGRWSLFALYVTPSTSREGAYERIGIIKWHCYENAKPHKRWFKGSEKREILLI